MDYYGLMYDCHSARPATAHLFRFTEWWSICILFILFFHLSYYLASDWKELKGIIMMFGRHDDALVESICWQSQDTSLRVGKRRCRLFI
jgi:hypothetical protein